MEVVRLLLDRGVLTKLDDAPADTFVGRSELVQVDAARHQSVKSGALSWTARKSRELLQELRAITKILARVAPGAAAEH